MTLKNEIDKVDKSNVNLNVIKNNTNVVLEKHGETSAITLSEIPKKIDSIESKMTKYADITLNKTIKATYSNKAPHVEIPLPISFNPKKFCMLFETPCSHIAQIYGSKAIVAIGGSTENVLPAYIMQTSGSTTIDITLRNMKIENKVLKFDFEGYISGEYYTKEINLKSVSVIG